MSERARKNRQARDRAKAASAKKQREKNAKIKVNVRKGDLAFDFAGNPIGVLLSPTEIQTGGICTIRIYPTSKAK